MSGIIGRFSEILTGSLKIRYGEHLHLFTKPFTTNSRMPKSKGTSGKGSSSSTKDASGDTVKSPVGVGKDGEISIAIQVKPGAKTDAITDISETAIGVQISAPPVDGEANTALVKYFASLLKVKKTDVSIKGGKSKQKTIFVSSSTGLTPDQITDLLMTEKQQC